MEKPPEQRKRDGAIELNPTKHMNMLLQLIWMHVVCVGCHVPRMNTMSANAPMEKVIALMWNSLSLPSTLDPCGHVYCIFVCSQTKI